MTRLIITILLFASSASAMVDRKAIEETVGPAAPEPTAVVMFLAATALVAWRINRR